MWTPELTWKGANLTLRHAARSQEPSSRGARAGGVRVQSGETRELRDVEIGIGEIGRSGEAPRLCNNPPNHSKTQWCNTRVQIRNTAPENHTHMHTGQTSCAAPLCPSLTAPRPLSMVPACGMLCRIGTDKAALPRSSSCPIGSDRMGLRLSRRLSRLDGGRSRLDLASISPQSRATTSSPTRASKLTTSRATPG